jgi:hypothetical protein
LREAALTDLQVVFTPEAKIHYRSTWISVIVCMVFTSIAALVLRVILIRENKRRDEKYGPVIEPSLIPSSTSALADKSLDREEAFEDLTDHEQTSFRYSL